MVKLVEKERVRLGDRSYDIVIGAGLLKEGAGGLVQKACGLARKPKAGFYKEQGNDVLLVSNRQVYGLYGGSLAKELDRAGVKWRKLLIPDGERYKTMATVTKIHDALVKGKYDRGTSIVALGGGVIGDIAGFSAATYMRGIGVIQVPTTLLSQVDSSVGGKTGVNHPKGKNLIGAFYQPKLVIADVSTLKSLPNTEVLCGVAEIIKYGCIASKSFFSYLQKNINRLVALNTEVVVKSVRTSCKIKAGVVADDERESGVRATLNFGHTAGHAIEAVTGYRKYPHGIAVAMGMRVAAELSLIKGGLRESEVNKIVELMEKAGLPTGVPKSIDTGSLVRAMKHDKKVEKGTIRFALLNGIGRCEIRSDISRSEIRTALKRSILE